MKWDNICFRRVYPVIQSMQNFRWFSELGHVKRARVSRASVSSCSMTSALMEMRLNTLDMLEAMCGGITLGCPHSKVLRQTEKVMQRNGPMPSQGINCPPPLNRKGVAPVGDIFLSEANNHLSSVIKSRWSPVRCLTRSLPLGSLCRHFRLCVCCFYSSCIKPSQL